MRKCRVDMASTKVILNACTPTWIFAHPVIGTWIPLHEGRLLSERNNSLGKLRPIFDFIPGDRSPPPAPKHSTSSKPKAPRNNSNRRKIPHEEVFSAVKPIPPMGPPSLPHDQYDLNPGFEEDESVEQTTLESSSMMADEEMMPMSQHGPHSRKRKRVGMNEAPVMSISEQEHILYGDQLLDYFMTVGDAPEATRIAPPEPPANFQVDRAIDDSRNTALHWACAMGDLDIVKDLLRRGADMRALSVHEETPLVRAVLFTNNYEKRTFSALLDLLLDTVSFRDWFGATIFHHLAETTRSKGKWKSSRYYCDALLEKLRNTYSQDEIDLLLSCQDCNGDSAALVASRNGAFRLVTLLLKHCPRAGDLVNKKGETTTGIMERAHHSERDIPPRPSSATMGNDQIDGEPDGDLQFASHSQDAADTAPATSALLSKVGVLMGEANKKLAVSYGSTKANQQDSEDVANPEALHHQLELDRRNIQQQYAGLAAKEPEQGPTDAQIGRYEQLRRHYESLLEQIQHARLGERLRSATTSGAKKPEQMNQSELLVLYQLSQQLCSAQKMRRAAVKDLAQQTADAGVSTKFDVHRKLVSLATGLKEEELDPMAGELAETLEFDRMNGKGAGAESPEPEHHRQPSPRGSTSFGFPGPAVPADA